MKEIFNNNGSKSFVLDNNFKVNLYNILNNNSNQNKLYSLNRVTQASASKNNYINNYSKKRNLNLNPKTKFSFKKNIINENKGIFKLENNKNENKNLILKLEQLENELKEEKRKNKELEIKVEQLKNKLENVLNKNNDLFEILKEKNNSNDQLLKTIKEKDEIINELKLKLSQYPFELKKGEKLITLNFASLDESIQNYSIICKSKDIFNHIETKLYEDFPSH